MSVEKEVDCVLWLQLNPTEHRREVLDPVMGFLFERKYD